MRLLAFRLHEAPGIPRGFELEDLDRELVLIHGPNGSGKSTFCRAVRATLWPGGERWIRGVSRWRAAGGDWFAELRDGAVRWQHAGRDAGSPPPGIPEPALAPCYLLSLRDLLPEDGATEQDLAARLRREMAGGYDLEAVREEFLEVGLPRRPVTEYREARKELSAVEQGFRDLAAEEARLRKLRAELRALRRRAEEAGHLAAARDHQAARAAQARLERQLADFPPGMERLDGRELQRLDQTRERIRRLEETCRDLERERLDAAEKVAAIGLEEALDGETRERLDLLGDELARAEAEIRKGSEDREATVRRLRRSLTALPVADVEQLQAPTPARAAELDRLLDEARRLEIRRRESPSGGGEGPAPWLAPALLGLVLLAGLGGLLWGWPALLLGTAAAVALFLVGRRRRPARGEQDADALARRLAEDFRTVARDLGLDPTVSWADSPLATGNCIDHLKTLLAARAELDDVAARLEAALRRRQRLLAEVGEVLGLEAPPADVVAARAAIRDRLARSDALIRARRDLQAVELELAARKQELEDLREELDALHREAGIPLGGEGRAVLLDRLGRLEEWRRLQDELRLARSRAAELADRLTGHEDLLTLTPEELAERLAEAAEAADRLEERSQEVGRLQERLDRTRRGRSFEEAFARLAAAREDLEGSLAAFLRAQAAAFLLAEVEREHQDRTRPRALQEAGGLLVRFTAGALTLDLAREGGGTFRARDTASGRGLALAELSDATRIQLLLAVRVGYLLAREGGGEPLPLFLDEALGTSDPRRFQAVGEALLELAAAGRQVFYLTADPADVQAWERLCAARGRPAPVRVDLAAARGQAGAWDPEAAPPQPPAPPDPALTREEFVRALGVAAPDGWQEAGALDLYHILWDDRPLVASLAASGVRRVGAWLAFDEEGRNRLAGSPDRARRVTARCRVVEALWPLWRQGRARPVDLKRLAEAEKENGRALLTPAIREPVLNRLRELDGDATAFLEEALGIEGLGRKKREELREWFETEGCLPSGVPLSEAECIARVQEALGDSAEATLESAEVAGLVRRLLALLG